MASQRTLDKLPKCALIETLERQGEQRHDTDFDFLGELNRFRERVSAEVTRINELFPEYTPHDEKYHLKRLFHVAETVLGEERLEAMNSAELFVLAVGLYGHDWGMAVSRAEKEFIVSGVRPEGTEESDIWLLPDERDRFAKFVRDNGLPVDENGVVHDLTNGLWREYVRDTHADRSGERVRRYFDTINGGVADAGDRVCV